MWGIKNDLTNKNKNTKENYFGKTKFNSEQHRGLLYFQLDIRFFKF